MTKSALDSFVGVSDICGMASNGTTASHVAGWRKTFDDFPEPVGYLGGRPAYKRSEVSKWLKTHGKLANPTG